MNLFPVWIWNQTPECNNDFTSRLFSDASAQLQAVLPSSETPTKRGRFCCISFESANKVTLGSLRQKTHAAASERGAKKHGSESQISLARSPLGAFR